MPARAALPSTAAREVPRDNMPTQVSLSGLLKHKGGLPTSKIVALHISEWTYISIGTWLTTDFCIFPTTEKISLKNRQKGVCYPITGV